MGERVRIEIDVQLFADPDRTEKPTPRRRQRARQEGNVATSRELNMAVAFLFMSGLLLFLGYKLALGILGAWEPFLSLDMHDDMSVYLLGEMFKENFMEPMLVLAIMVLGTMGAGILVGALQTRFLITFRALRLDFNRINPVQGFKRMFSLRSVFELLKALLKVVIVGYIGYLVLRREWGKVLLYPMMDPSEAMGHLTGVMFSLAFQTGIALLALAVFDYFFQRWEYEKSLMMTRHELKEEMKDIEGNPEVKRRQRQMMMDIMRRRMMEEVPKATVVITNPTHVAVALRYDPDEDEAPVVVAKGLDEIAQRIREIALENGVPIVRNPPLAWELYKRVEIGEEISSDLYRAVAEVLAYIYSLKE